MAETPKTYDAGLGLVLDEDDAVNLARAQRETAVRWGQWAVAERLTVWLVANGYEEQS